MCGGRGSVESVLSYHHLDLCSKLSYQVSRLGSLLFSLFNLTEGSPGCQVRVTSFSNHHKTLLHCKALYWMLALSGEANHTGTYPQPPECRAPQHSRRDTSQSIRPEREKGDGFPMKPCSHLRSVLSLLKHILKCAFFSCRWNHCIMELYVTYFHVSSSNTHYVCTLKACVFIYISI